jgi:hypothetical protein
MRLPKVQCEFAAASSAEFAASMANSFTLLRTITGPRKGSQLGRVYPRPLSRETQVATAILDRTVAHVPDFDAPGVPAQSLTLARASSARNSEATVPRFGQP